MHLPTPAKLILAHSIGNIVQLTRTRLNPRCSHPRPISTAKHVIIAHTTLLHTKTMVDARTSAAVPLNITLQVYPGTTAVYTTIISAASATNEGFSR